MPQTRNNGGVVPVPSDPYNPPADMATQTDSLDVVRRVGSGAAQAALTDLRVGTVMCRYDLPDQPLFTWNGTYWVASSADVQVGQGAARSAVKGGEVLVTTNEFSVGFLVFPTPFPNACAAITITHSTPSLTALSFRIVTRNSNSVEFVAYNSSGTGVPSSALYLNYIAVGY